MNNIQQQAPAREQYANDTQRQIAELKAELLKNYTIAQSICAAAEALDYLKNLSDKQAAREAEKHIDSLHVCAAMLAGDRAHELYGTEEESNALEAVLAAGCACCSGEVSPASPGWQKVGSEVMA